MLLALVQNNQQFGTGWAEHEKSASCVAARGMQIKALVSATVTNFISG